MYNYEGRRDPTVGTAFGRTSAAREQDGSVGGSQRVGDSPALALTSCGKRRDGGAKGRFVASARLEAGLPLFYGATRAKVKAARKEREMIALEIKEQEQLRQQEYLSALSRMNAAYVRYTYYNEEGRERSDKMAEQGLLAYSQGEISYLEYMNVLQESIDLRLKRASALNDYNQCVLVMEKLCGRQ